MPLKSKADKSENSLISAQSAKLKSGQFICYQTGQVYLLLTVILVWIRVLVLFFLRIPSPTSGRGELGINNRGTMAPSIKILLIKTSSLGDVLHTFPALTDALEQFPQLEVSWVVEEAFAAIPTWHPAVKKVLPIALRRWRKNFSKKTVSEIRSFLKVLRSERYDYVIDAQGLLKSAIISRLAKGQRYGLDYQSAREPTASFAYQNKIAVSKSLHAVVRLRKLFAKIFAYEANSERLDYGIQLNLSNMALEWLPAKYVVFLHATTWDTKLYPEIYWRRLIQQATQQGYTVILPWGNLDEKARSQRLSEGFTETLIPPKLSLVEVAAVLQKAQGIIAVDTGLGHFAAALSVPTVSLYGPTNPELTGTLGRNQVHLAVQFECAPCLQRECTYKVKKEVFPACFATLKPERVWQVFCLNHRLK